MQPIFSRLRVGTLIGGLTLVAAVLLILRSQARGMHRKPAGLPSANASTGLIGSRRREAAR